MATLSALQCALRQRAPTESFPTQPLSPTQYSAGFNVLLQGDDKTYRNFIVPQLCESLAPLFKSRAHISLLEVGPGPKSILGYLPSYLRQKIRKYAAFEPNSIHATRLEEWLRSKSLLPCLETTPEILQMRFAADSDRTNCVIKDEQKFDIILFCHSMYGMKPKRKFIEHALDMLVQQPQHGVVVVFHRDKNLHLDGLVCQRIASFPTGEIRIPINDETLDHFTRFIAGFVMQDRDVNKAIHVEWRNLCHVLGRHDEAYPDHLIFSSPNIMLAFTKQATKLSELIVHVPLAHREMTVKSWQARSHHPASVVRPTEVRHAQQCVLWALAHGLGLAIVGGGHSGHCIQPNVVSVDMSAFNQVHIITSGKEDQGFGVDSNSVVVAEAGCKTGDIISKTMEVGLTVPLGARPSVGAGLWLQGGIGHLARLHGLACDSIIGAVMISVESGQILCLGNVPRQHQPVDAVRPENETDILWALRGAGTNFGVVISVTFRAFTAPIYSVRNWVIPLCDSFEASLKLDDFDKHVASRLPRNHSADAYLYWEAEQLHLGVTVFESAATEPPSGNPTFALTPADTFLGSNYSLEVANGVSLFNSEMYISGMHSGHGGGKTSSFKRCLFLKHIGAEDVNRILIGAVEARPSPLCYLHLLQGGGAVGDLGDDATAFGCRDWMFACVITGVWPREQDGTCISRTTVQWVYNIAEQLLPLSTGAYGADLGPDPRDAALASKAFGPNRSRLGYLKKRLDPNNVLSYACPLLKMPEQQLIVLVTGEVCAGKDYCANIWTSVFNASIHNDFRARTVSISEVCKREYAAATGSDLERLLLDRTYKEQHRPALTRFFQNQVRQRPQLPEEHFMNVVYDATDVDVLLITGMRDQAPLATFSHLVPNRRLLEVRVKSSDDRQWEHATSLEVQSNGNGKKGSKDSTVDETNLAALDYRPSFVFQNDRSGNEAAEQFAKQYLLPFFHEDLQRLAFMVRDVPGFPQPDINFRHVLNISQKSSGLALCTSLFQARFTGNWGKIHAIVCCEAGGFVFASALAVQVNLPLVLIRQAGKLPPPTVSVAKFPSHISSSVSTTVSEDKIEMNLGLVSRGAAVVVIDDVLATGHTLLAVLRLLGEVGIPAEDISVMVVAEFPIHRGREQLYKNGFGRVHIQSLLVFDGM
ncbi:hypothetical protein S40285_08258 [Stachybotrys chlorohalonatus IBT 40285]|uniref:FAD-binding PCMH-type domain-containing protein n=1 Tax=Stachybotrys chlorohalonatus (strain IBT 40285) TaxID=1283841 RepID=A0A084R208_STAC4|nr:hypothetical protein S40285_08258 [Stachybotrys chlorohalonata IBT 40285]